MKDKTPQSLAVKKSLPKVTLQEGRQMAKHTGIRKLKNGRFRARYFAGFDSKGKRKYPARTFDTQSQAVQWRSEQVSIKLPGRLVEGGQTVGEYLDRWLAMKKQALRENSLEMYRCKVNQYLKPALGKIRLVRLSASHIETMQADLLERGLSATTVSAARVVLGGAMKKAVRMGLIRSNPVTGSDAPKVKKPTRYPLTVEEALRFLQECETSRLGLYFRLALTTGIRPEEAFALQWANVQLGERGVLNIKQVINRLKGGGWKWNEPKSENGVRSIVFPADLVAMLVEHRKAQLEQKIGIGKYWQNNDLVFCTGIGSPLAHSHVNAEFKCILKRVGLPKKVRMYDLRHAFVTFSLLAGVDAKTVSEDAGHASVAFTLDHYGHVLKEMREAASDKRAELMRNRGGNR